MQKDVRVKLKKDLEKIYLQYAKHSDEEERLAFMNELACKAKQVALFFGSSCHFIIFFSIWPDITSFWREHLSPKHCMLLRIAH